MSWTATVPVDNIWQWRILALYYLIFLVVAEAFLESVPLLGLILYSGLLFSLLIQGSLAESKAVPLMSAMMLVSLLRLLAFGLLITRFSLITRNALIALFMLPPLIIHCRLYSLTLQAAGITLRRPMIQIILALSASLIGYGLLVQLYPTGIAPDYPAEIAFIPLIVGVEEILFRGILLHTLADFLGEFAAILYTGLIFAVMFIARDPLLALIMFTLSLFYGIIALRFSGVLAVVIASTATMIQGGIAISYTTTQQINMAELTCLISLLLLIGLKAVTYNHPSPILRRVNALATPGVIPMGMVFIVTIIHLIIPI